MRDLTDLHAEILERCIPGIWRDLGLVKPDAASTIEEWRKPIAGQPTCPDCGCRVTATGDICGPCYFERQDRRERVEPEYLEADGPWEVD